MTRTTAVDALVEAARELADAASQLAFEPPAEYVYNPLQYAWDAHETYLRMYGGRGAKVLLTGMNPGPWGMAQTGVPFGDVEHVRDWLGVSQPVDRPPREHPKRPVLGFDCPRREVSGQRLWGWAKARYGEPGRFFEHFFVYNYCPLAFLEASGRNRTPDKLPAAEQAPLRAICDKAFRAAVAALKPDWIAGVGAYAEARARAALQGVDGLRFARIPHPSPASPAANRGWSAAAEAALTAQGVPY